MKPNSQITNKIIKETVFRCLCSVLKKHHLYAQFRCMMGAAQRPRLNHNGARLTVALNHAIPSIGRFQNKYGRDNLFAQASCKEDIFDILDNTDHSLDMMMPPLNAQEASENGRYQMQIIQLINTLLRCCVESYVRDFKRMEALGGEIFDKVCKTLFGDDFVDETEKFIPQNVKNALDAQQAFMESHGIEDIPQLRGNQDFARLMDELACRIRPMRRDEQPRDRRDDNNTFFRMLFDRNMNPF